jgi:hypothetical protein
MSVDTCAEIYKSNFHICISLSSDKVSSPFTLNTTVFILLMKFSYQVILVLIEITYYLHTYILVNSLKIVMQIIH